MKDGESRGVAREGRFCRLRHWKAKAMRAQGAAGSSIDDHGAVVFQAGRGLFHES